MYGTSSGRSLLCFPKNKDCTVKSRRSLLDDDGDDDDDSITEKEFEGPVEVKAMQLSRDKRRKDRKAWLRIKSAAYSLLLFLV